MKTPFLTEKTKTDPNQEKSEPCYATVIAVEVTAVDAEMWESRMKISPKDDVIFVNPKQYPTILKRRLARRKQIADGKILPPKHVHIKKYDFEANQALISCQSISAQCKRPWEQVPMSLSKSSTEKNRENSEKRFADGNANGVDCGTKMEQVVAWRTDALLPANKRSSDTENDRKSAISGGKGYCIQQCNRESNRRAGNVWKSNHIIILNFHSSKPKPSHYCVHKQPSLK